MTRDTATYGHMYVQIQHERVTCSSSENPAKFPNTLLPSLSLSLPISNCSILWLVWYEERVKRGTCWVSYSISNRTIVLGRRVTGFVCGFIMLLVWLWEFINGVWSEKEEEERRSRGRRKDGQVFQGFTQSSWSWHPVCQHTVNLIFPFSLSNLKPNKVFLFIKWFWMLPFSQICSFFGEDAIFLDSKLWAVF